MIEAATDELHLLAAPSPTAEVVAAMRLSPRAPLDYDSTRFQTIRPSVLTVVASSTVSGRDLGPISFLSRGDYYSQRYPQASIPVAPGSLVDYLQYRAEGTCFVRVDGRIIDANPCPAMDTVAFRASGEPGTLWWIKVNASGGASGWVQVSDTTARVVRRAF